MSIYSRPVRFTEAEGKSDAFEILLKELGITVEPKGALEQICPRREGAGGLPQGEGEAFSERRFCDPTCGH